MKNLNSDSFAFLFNAHGKYVKLKDLTYQIKSGLNVAIYPYPHTSYRIHLEPVDTDDPEYCEVKKILKDHWVLDVETLDVDDYNSILTQLNYYELEI